MNVEKLIEKVKNEWFNISACVSLFNSSFFFLATSYLFTSPNPKEYWLTFILGYGASLMFYLLALWLFKNKKNNITEL